MFKAGYAQEIITPPVGIGLAGYFNARPNIGAYDDLYVKVLAMECGGTKCALAAFDLVGLRPTFQKSLSEAIVKEFGQELADNIIISAIHTHTGTEFPAKEEDITEPIRYALNETVEAAIRAIRRAFMNLQEGQLEATSVYNNP